jgi:replication fork protection complex subunit Csm3/Swi3
MMPAAAPSDRAPRHDDLDNYNVADLSDDPFASPPSSPKHKRKQADAGLGIDEEVSVQKRQRAPAAKLDEDRLLSTAGIPELRKRAKKLRFKGKGHEVRALIMEGG